MQGQIAIGGSLSTRVIRAPGPGLAYKVRNFPNLWPGLWRREIAKILGVPTFYGELSARLIKLDGTVINYAVISTRVVTTGFVDFVVDQLQIETSEFGDFKYHDSGEGTTAAATSDTDMESTDGESRATGTQTEGGSTNIYRTVATISYTSTKAITEHGVFSQSSGGTLVDRHVFSALNVENGDSIEFTYNLTFSAGG